MDHQPDDSYDTDEPLSDLEELDFSLLDQLLNHLGKHQLQLDTPQISLVATFQHEEETNDAMTSYLCTIFDRSSWHHIRKGLVEFPLLCLNCKKLVCKHMSTAYCPYTEEYPGLAVLWDDYQLAVYAQEKMEVDLEFGLFN